MICSSKEVYVKSDFITYSKQVITKKTVKNFFFAPVGGLAGQDYVSR